MSLRDDLAVLASVVEAMPEKECGFADCDDEKCQLSEEQLEDKAAARSALARISEAALMVAEAFGRAEMKEKSDG